MNENKAPVLLLIFNRPDTTYKVLEAIRKYQPERLYVAADGPRFGVKEDIELCNATRALVDTIDWNCEVKTLFRDDNLGCAKSVSDSISWYFSHEIEGIILEDDCLPHFDFFPYCSELLIKYRNNESIAMISGNNFQNGVLRGNDSYYFSIIPNIWGWATWKRTWDHFKLVQSNDDINLIKANILTFFKKKKQVFYWNNLLNQVNNSFFNSWGYPFLFSLWTKNVFCIAPNSNLVSNIGFDNRATHTKNHSICSEIETKNILPIKHPKYIQWNEKADEYYFEHFLQYNQTLIGDFKSFVYKILILVKNSLK